MSEKKHHIYVAPEDMGHEKTKQVKVKALDKKISALAPNAIGSNAVILGYTDIGKKGYADTDKDSVRIENLEFVTQEHTAKRIIGYLPVDGGTAYIGVFATTIIPIILLAGAFILAVGIIVDHELHKIPVDDGISNSDIVIADGKDFDGNVNDGFVSEREATGYIEIPGYSEIYVTAGSVVDLANPEANNVYFKYTITENDTVLYETDYITPGQKVEWNPTEYVQGAGDHELTFAISTVNVDTKAPCNGATFAVVAHVS